MWKQSRRKQMEENSELISTLAHINQGSAFIENVKRCITIAKKLDKTDLYRGTKSFKGFLRDEAFK